MSNTALKIGKTVKFKNTARGLNTELTGKVTAIDGNRVHVEVKNGDSVKQYKPFASAILA